MIDLFNKVWEALFVPGFAAGFVVGNLFMYFGTAKGWITNPPLTQVKSELAGVKAELRLLRKEFEVLEEFRNGLVRDKLRKAKEEYEQGIPKSPKTS